MFPCVLDCFNHALNTTRAKSARYDYPTNGVKKRNRSLFLDVFGRPNPSAEAPCERDPSPTIVQSLHFMNSDQIQARIGYANSRADLLAKSDKTPKEIVEEIYLSAYARFPSEEEEKIAVGAYSMEGASRKSATEDVIWALINTAEFVLNH